MHAPRRRLRRRSPAVFVLLAALAAPLACARNRTHAEEAQGESLRDLVALFGTDEQSVERFWWIDVSPARIARLREFHAEWERRLEAVDFDRLGVAGRIDAILLRNHLAAEGRALARAEARMAEMASLLPFRERLVALEEARWRGSKGDAQESATALDAVVAEIDTLRKRLQAGLKPKDETAAENAASTNPPPELLAIRPSVALRAAGAIDGIRRALAGWFRNQSGYVPEFSWWVAEPYQRLEKSLDEYAQFLRDDCTGEKPEKGEKLIGDPIGREALVEELEREMIAYTPEELIAIAEQELAWCEMEMDKASHELGLGGDKKAAVEHVKKSHVPPGEQAQLVIGQAQDAIAFLDARDLVTIPPLCRETWRYEMLNAEGQRTLPYAAYDTQAMMVAYPTQDMTHESKLMSMRGNNVHFSRIVTPHELIPGHHLQLFVAERNNTHRAPFRTPFLVEGWALYWEMLLWKLGYPRGPEDRVGMLFWRQHRSARIIVSLRFHLGTMSPQEMVDFLVERVGHERDGATSEIRRYIGEDYGPLYQCAYMGGGLQLMALRGEFVDTGAMTNRAFHDAVLVENAIPFELIRASLRGERLSRNFRSTWRFAGEPARASIR